MKRRALKLEKTLCGETGHAKQKRGSVKRNTEELGGGVEGKGGACQSELGLMRRLVGVRAEEAAFTFSGVDWEAPFQGPFFKVVKDLLNSVGSLHRVGGRRPDGEIIRN